MAVEICHYLYSKMSEESKSDDKKELTHFDARDEFATGYSYLDVLEAVEASGVNDLIGDNITSAWRYEVVNGFPGKVTDMGLFIEEQKKKWDGYFKLLEDHARKKAMRQFLSKKKREELKEKEKEERRARRARRRRRRDELQFIKAAAAREASKDE